MGENPWITGSRSSATNLTLTLTPGGRLLGLLGRDHTVGRRDPELLVYTTLLDHLHLDNCPTMSLNIDYETGPNNYGNGRTTNGSRGDVSSPHPHPHQYHSLTLSRVASTWYTPTISTLPNASVVPTDGSPLSGQLQPGLFNSPLYTLGPPVALFPGSLYLVYSHGQYVPECIGSTYRWEPSVRTAVIPRSSYIGSNEGESDPMFAKRTQ
ncbi:hypothetical protein QJS04_geneDACA022923 [Acorus gramineus]|uniref:Uncharacterized protein n=1 Tax=Acorus gramineus TaxID=55184 RepID=A0AAV9A119_ACOGR|nr:hypothetical protein QJS04_geneDACA022923 [Acorus gramineus]